MMKLSYLFATAALVAVSGCAFAQDVAPTGLYGYWMMDEGTGLATACDNNAAWAGTLNGNATWVDGKFGKCVNFDGTDGFVALPGNTVLPVPNTSAVSFSFWATMDELPGALATSYRSVYNSATSQDNYIVYADKAAADLRMKVLTAAGGNYKVGIPSASFTVGTWFHAAFVYDGSEMRSYYNGVLANTLATPSGGLVKTSTVQDSSIGRKTGATAQFWKGKLDEMAVFTRVLTAAEITKLAAGDRSLKQLMSTGVADWSQF